jgi:Uma2 family endonuclease
MSAARHPSRATAADLDSDRRAEIIRGAIVDKASPTPGHSVTQLSLGGYLRRRFARRPGGRWPGGWWFGTEIHVEYQTHELYCHDVAGWRRERAPQVPDKWPVRIRPDWVCEILSPKHEKRDLVDKMRVLREAGVPHYWVLNAAEKILVVHRLEAAGYLIALSASAGETVRAEPFDDVELPVSVIFGDEDEEE